MMLAPQPQLTTLHRYYSTGMRGVAQTLGIMRAMVRAGRIDPRIRQTATSILFMLESSDRIEAEKLLEFVQNSIRYVKDVHDVETISTPEKTLLGRIGDCDDQATLLAALYESVGYPTRFVVAAYQVKRVMEHVYLQVLVNGEWLDADPTERYPLGWAPPGALSIFTERI